MKFRRALRVLLAAVLLLLITAGLAWWNLPFLVSRWGLPRLEKMLDAKIRAEVDRCDASGVTLRRLSFQTSRFQFRAGEVVAGWRLSLLRNREIDRLRVRGARLEVSVPFPASPTPLVLDPFVIRQLEVMDGSILVELPAAAGGQARMKLELAGLNGRTAVYHQRAVDGPDAGFATLDALRLDGVRIASASATLVAGNSSFRLQGRCEVGDALVPGACAEVTGGVTFSAPSDPGLDLAFTVPPFKLDTAAPGLARLLRRPPPFTASATLGASGRLGGTGRHPVLPVRLDVSGGRIEGRDGAFVAEEVGAVLQSADVLGMESLPAQELNIGKLTAGDKVLSALRMRFRVEPAGVLFVEEGSLSWCGGWLRLYAMRLRSEHDLDLTVYCDQLKLDELLGQIGFKDITTNASLSGRLPVQLRDGRLQIRGGDLFSHPGVEGVLRIGGADILSGSLDPGSPAHGNILFTQAALKHFRFDWIRMKIDTDDEQVRIAISLFGKPAEPLPFRYDSRTDAFVKLAVRGEAGISNPVGLTMNVNLPMRGLVYDRGGWMTLLRDLK